MSLQASLATKDRTQAVRLSRWSLYLADSVLTTESWWSQHHPVMFARGFVELCSIIEAAVLFEHMYVELDLDRTPLRVSPLARTLYDASVLKEDTIVATAYDGKERPDVRAMLQSVQNALLTPAEGDEMRSHGTSLIDAIRDDLVTEASTIFSGFAFKPLSIRPMRSPIERPPARVETDLLRVYSMLSDRFRESQRQRVFRGYPCRVFIPPIAAVVLETAGNRENVPRVILDFRDRMAPLRKQFAHLGDLMRSDEASFQEVRQAEKSLERIGKILTTDGQEQDTARVAFLRNLGSFLIKSLLRLGIDYESLFKILSSDSAEWVARRYETHSALFMTDVRKKYMSMKKYGRLTERVFGHPLTEIDAEILQHTATLDQRDISSWQVDVTDGWLFLQRE